MFSQHSRGGFLRGVSAVADLPGIHHSDHIVEEVIAALTNSEQAGNTLIICGAITGTTRMKKLTGQNLPSGKEPL